MNLNYIQKKNNYFDNIIINWPERQYFGNKKNFFSVKIYALSIKRKYSVCEDGSFLTLMKYKDLNDIYLAYECHYKENIHNVRSVLGVSLLGKNENIIIPNDEERKYKFIYGKD